MNTGNIEKRQDVTSAAVAGNAVYLPFCFYGGFFDLSFKALFGM